MRSITIIVNLLFFLILLSWNAVISANTPSNSPHVAIIIDDLGNGLKGTDEILSLKAPLTVAVMPLFKTSKEDAIRAHQTGFEVLLQPVSWLIR